MTHLPLPHWLHLFWALQKIPVTLLCAPTASIYYLADAVLNGHVQTRFPNGDIIPPEQWHVPENGRGLETESGMTLDEAEINRADFFKWLKSCEPQIGRRRGPRAKYDWQKLYAYLITYINREALPETKQVLVDLAEEWFLENYSVDDRPKTTAIKDQVYLFYNTQKKADVDGI